MGRTAGAAVRLVLAAGLLAGCGGSSTGTTSAPSSVPQVPDLARPGVPKAVGDAATGATVTLNAVRYAPSTSAGDTLNEFALFDLSFTGTGTAPFPYSASDLAINYGGGSDPFNHPDDSRLYGPALDDDPSPYGPPPPLRVGSLSKGQTVRGLVLIRLGLHTPYILDLTDGAGTNIAQWALTSK